MTTVLLDHDSLPALCALDADAAQAPARTHLVGGTVPIVDGMELTWSVAADHGEVALAVKVAGLLVWRATLGLGQTTAAWRGSQEVFKEDVVFAVDVGRGELTIAGDVCIGAGNAWRCHRFDAAVLVAWSPTLGAVGDSSTAHPPQVAGSSSVVPTITRIPVDTRDRIGTPVGKMVKQRLFASVPDFEFNVCFAVGPFRLFRPGVYGNPTSPWFNVFVGYYQLDCPKPAWTRPFGYTAGGAAIDFDDVQRIGKADWNYFSNWMYGVPLEAVTPYDGPDPGVVCRELGRVAVGKRGWDLIDVDGFTAVSAYQAGGGGQLVDNTVLTPVWRSTYGEPKAQPGWDTSFIGTKLHARLYIAWREEADRFRTWFFGGTVNKAFDGKNNDAFLAAQLAACEQVMITHYPTLGFDP